MRPDIYNQKIFVIVPVYNESEEMLASVLKSLLSTPFNVILVDDGSQHPVTYSHSERLALVRHRINLGQGAALQTGFTVAKKKKADFVITYDADGQHQTSDIYNLLEPLINNEADITLGSRFLKGASHNAGAARYFTLFIARMISNLSTGINLSDVHNGLRGLNKKALECMHLTENRMAHATELINQIKKCKLRYREVPVNIVYSDYSRKKGQRFTDGIKVFFDIVLHKLFE